MTTEDNQAAERDDQREDYSAPRIAILGKVEDLTKGGALPAVTDVTFGGTI